MAKIRPLLRDALAKLEIAKQRDAANYANTSMEVLRTQLDIDNDGGTEKLPIIMQAKPQRPKRGETWPEYKERVKKIINKLNDVVSGGAGTPLYLANAVSARLDPAQILHFGDNDFARTIELDQMFKVTTMDDAVVDVGLQAFRNHTGGLTGAGTRVAVLDSGIDVEHPNLEVEASVSTCGEAVEIPGRHGTHCAGIIASRDTVFPGLAPGCTLLNIKVLRQDGSGTSSFITKGIDEALDLDADVLSMSLGFNHLPRWSNGGHGWTCPDGRCELCTAVDNAVFFGAVVCVAAGNEHGRSESLRAFGQAGTFDTELGCPGQARGAITVGAITKRTFLPADFSSRGPTAYNTVKPDLTGPGVNVMSTVPVPRNVRGKPTLNPSQAELFDRESGTSMATPIVAGAAALLVQHRRQKGLSVSPKQIRKTILTDLVTRLALPSNVVGSGRVDLSTYGAPVPTS